MLYESGEALEALRDLGHTLEVPRALRVSSRGVLSKHQGPPWTKFTVD